MQLSLNIEAKYLDLGDKRRNHRLFEIVENHVKNPSGSIPEVNREKYGLKAEYHFYSSELVEEENIQEAVVAATIERASDHPLLLVLHDTSNISFSHKAQGLGYLDHGFGRGVMLHHSLVVTPEEEIIGEIHQKMWERPFEERGKTADRRKREITEKESYKWIEGFLAADQALPGECKKIHIADREADIYELFITPLSPNSDFLIRGTHKRKTSEGKLIRELMESQPVKGTNKLSIKRGKDRVARVAELEYRFCKVTLLPPHRRLNKSALPIEVNAILVEEKNPPKGTEAIEWFIYTTLPVNSMEDAVKYVLYYSKRWLIERFHFVLKSGCKLEELQLGTVSQLRKAIVTYSIIATRLMQLTYYSRVHPDSPCDKFLEVHEWEALYFTEHKKNPPSKPPKMKDAVLWIAKLGGFVGRKSDGDPGVETTWKGLKILGQLAIMWNDLKNQRFSK